MENRHIAIRALLHLLLFFNLTHAASLVLLSRDGSGSVQGWEGTSYQAIRYEPLCGNLGTADYYRQVYALSPYCQPAIEVFTNITDSFGLYDNTGVRLRGPDARIGAGVELCVCFALQQIQDRNLAGAFCIYVNGNAQAYLDGSIALNYRPGLDASRALPICGGGFDLGAAREAWSKTAVQPLASEAERTIGGSETATGGLAPSGRGGVDTPVTRVVTETAVSTAVSVSTYFPSVVPYTDSTIYTTTGTDGVARTVTSSWVTQMPVVTVSSASDSEGSSRNDKVTLGVGLGLGIPALILVAAGVFVGISLLRKGPERHKQSSEEAGIEG
ncbi:hypothetical protein TWF730_008379 [Orbilia blumenaviensis]|uniref:Uncharacterized protein n=1 Tax=Orbilia blumenaviensis TaxID=1796055 RepID=A0AAV9V3E4_9PEZI